MTISVLNPVVLPSPLLPAEVKFARCMREGSVCEIGTGELPQEPIKFGKNANVIRAEVIRFFAFGGDVHSPIRGADAALMGAWIPDDLDASFARVDFTMRFMRCRFASSVFLDHAELVNLFMSGSRLSRGLSGDGLKVSGSVLFNDAFSVFGETRVIEARIGGNLVCDDGEFNNRGGVAFGFDGSRVGGSVLMRRVSADGEVRLSRAHIGGYFDCEGGRFNNPAEVKPMTGNPGDEALKADGLVVNDDVFLRNGFSATGVVNLSGAQIGGDLECAGGTFTGNVFMENAEIKNSLVWGQVGGFGVVSLLSAKAGTLTGSMKSWKTFNVFLDGFVYGRFFDSDDVQSRLDWLGNRPIMAGFSPQPYEQVAKVLRAMGKPLDAWDVEREKNRLQREHDGESPVQKFGGWILDTLKDAVYRPLRTVKWAATVAAFGAAVFAVAGWRGDIVPTHPVVMLSEAYKGEVAPNGDSRPTRAVLDAIPEYPAFNPVAFSLDIFTPSAVLHQEESWGPRSGDGDLGASLSLAFVIAGIVLALCLLWLAALGLLCFVPFLAKRWDALWRWGAGVVVAGGLLAFFAAEVTLWYWIEIAAGWILVPLFVLSVTGVLRPRQSSGEKG